MTVSQVKGKGGKYGIVVFAVPWSTYVCLRRCSNSDIHQEKKEDWRMNEPKGISKDRIVVGQGLMVNRQLNLHLFQRCVNLDIEPSPCPYHVTSHSPSFTR